jgi:HK97 family phage major capsid protein
MPTLQELRDQRAAAWSQAQEYNERSTDTEVVMTAEDETAWERSLTDVDSLGEQIANRERTIALDARFSEIDDQTTPAGDDGGSIDEYRHAFERFCRVGPADLDPEERQLLQANFSAEVRAQGTATGGAGGYTVPEGFWAKVTETMAHFGGMLEVSEILTTDAGNDIPWPTNDDTGNTGAILAENIAMTEQDVVFGQKTLGSYTYTSKLIRVSLQLLQDAGVDIEAMLARKIGERLGRIQNTHATTGTGSSQPQGFVTGATVGKTAASATAITHNEIIDLEHSVDVSYRGDARFMFHDLVFAYIRKLKDSTGQPLWQPSVAAGAPSTLDGHDYTINNDMASAVATTNKTMAFGDFSAHYVLRQVNGGQMMRLAERYAELLQVGFFGFQRMDGLVQDTAAVKLLQQA